MAYYRTKTGNSVLESETPPRAKIFVEITKEEYDLVIEAKQGKQKIKDLKQKLAESDYKAIKFAEGEISSKEYEPIKAERQGYRDEINRLEALRKEVLRHVE